MPVISGDIARLIPHMRRFARALVGGHSVQFADDLVQETVVLAMRAERMACGPNLTEWCFSTLMRIHRLRDNSPASGTGAAVVQGSKGRPDTAVAFLPKPIARLDVLSLDCREALLLAVLVGMTHAQIAETLHITLDTAIHRLDLARGLLARADRGHDMSSAAQAGATARAARQTHYLRVVK